MLLGEEPLDVLWGPRWLQCGESKVIWALELRSCETSLPQSSCKTRVPVSCNLPDTGCLSWGKIAVEDGMQWTFHIATASEQDTGLCKAPKQPYKPLITTMTYPLKIRSALLQCLTPGQLTVQCSSTQGSLAYTAINQCYSLERNAVAGVTSSACWHQLRLLNAQGRRMIFYKA